MRNPEPRIPLLRRLENDHNNNIEGVRDLEWEERLRTQRIEIANEAVWEHNRRLGRDEPEPGAIDQRGNGSGQAHGNDNKPFPSNQGNDGNNDHMTMASIFSEISTRSTGGNGDQALNHVQIPRN